MGNDFVQPSRWNIFARELEDILSTRGLRLTHLDDRKVVYHREKVRRLQQSLASPKHLTTLNPMEMERLIDIMQLTDIEQKRLLAALLATSVEMTLMDRIPPDIALMATDEVFKILFAAMQSQPDLVVTTYVKAGVMVDNHEVIGDALFVQALDLLDRATLALHASTQATTQQTKVTHAHEALAAFTRTIELLKRSQSPEPESQTWMDWYEEALEGQNMAETLLQTVQEAQETQATQEEQRGQGEEL